MENINIAEILKDCPKGMELDCTTCNNVVTLVGVDKEGLFPIRVVSKSGFHHLLTCEGCVYADEDAKCVIFPKGKTTWEGFVPPCKYKNGDIVITTLGSTAIIKEPVCNTEYYAHCVWVCGKLITDDTVGAIRFATESEKAELFKAIKENGYTWNAEKKALKKLMIKPEFKAGDKIVKKNDVYAPIRIAYVDNGFYYFNTESSVGMLPISDQDSYELVPNKFDINSLVPFESRVLVRNTNRELWKPAIYGFLHDKCHYVVGGLGWEQCIPYEENKELLGTTNNPEEYGSR